MIIKLAYRKQLKIVNLTFPITEYELKQYSEFSGLYG